MIMPSRNKPTLINPPSPGARGQDRTLRWIRRNAESAGVRRQAPACGRCRNWNRGAGTVQAEEGNVLPVGEGLTNFGLERPLTGSLYRVRAGSGKVDRGDPQNAASGFVTATSTL
jgi:hypothetical protein